MPNSTYWILEQCKSLVLLLVEKLKKKKSWCFANGVRLIYRERREPRDGEVREFEQRFYEQGTGTLLVPAIRYSSSEEFEDLAKGSVGGTAQGLRAVALSISSVDKKFLRFLNSRAKEGQYLYFDIFLNEPKA